MIYLTKLKTEASKINFVYNSVYKELKQKRKKQIFMTQYTKYSSYFLARTVNINPFNMYIRSKLYSLKKKLKKHYKEVQKNHTDKINDTLIITYILGFDKTATKS